MPIKFRCDKCRQFLGISRAQAGHVVDCPTCGRATRVPKLDGTREPLPTQPGLESADPSLLNALDQLADLGTDSGKAKRSASFVAASVAGEPAVNKPATAKPIVLEPHESPRVVDPAPRSNRGSVEPGSSGAADSGEVLSQLASQSNDVPVPMPAQRLPALWISAAVLASVIAFAVGWYVGKSGRPVTPVSDVAVQAPKSVAIVDSLPKSTGVVGRITYRKSASECLPDRGSRVIAWPAGLEPKKACGLAGFRAGDSDELTQASRAELGKHGGDIGVVDDQGNFELNLPSGGEYEVLILSRFGGREPDSEGISTSQMVRLKACFDQPRKLVGQTQFALLRLKYRGQGQQLLDHVFDVAD